MSRISSCLRIKLDKSVIEGRLSLLLKCGSDFRLKLFLFLKFVTYLLLQLKVLEEPSVSIEMEEKDKDCHQHGQYHRHIGNSILIPSCAEIVSRERSKDNDVEVDKRFQ